MCLIYLYSVSFCSAAKMSFYQLGWGGGGGGGGGRLTSYKWDLLFYFLLLFLKIAWLSLLFHPKISFTRKNPARSDLMN